MSALIVCFLSSAGLAAEAAGTVRFEIREARRGGAQEPLVAATVFLEAADGQPLRIEDLPRSTREALGDRCPWFFDHLSCDGTLEIQLPEGVYGYVVERGPEYRRRRGRLDVKAGQAVTERVRLERWIDLARRGWWSGELHVHRPLEHLPLLLKASDLHVAAAITVWNQSDLWASRPLPENLLVEAEPTRTFHVLACEDERAGGALIYANLSKPLGFRGDRREHPSPVRHMEEAAAQPGAWIDVEKPFWWDVPAWVATGLVRSIGVANNHMCRRGMLEGEAWGRPRDASRHPPPRGNGFYGQEIYYRLLDCGFRIPPSAGSASGVLPNPLGYNRVYVRVPDGFSYDSWWRGLADGRCFVTNGPILLVEANGRPPGEVFRGEAGATVEVVLDVLVDGNDPLEAIEVVRDGEVVERLEGAELAGRWVRPGPLAFSRPGWFLVRAIADVPETFRFASSGPSYVEIGGAARTAHVEDVEYFLRWIDERVAALEASGEFRDAAERESVLRPHREARRRFLALLPGGG